MKKLSWLATIAAAVLLTSCATTPPATEAASCPNSDHPKSCCHEACNMKDGDHSKCTQKCMQNCKKHGKKHHHHAKAKAAAPAAAPAEAAPAADTTSGTSAN